MNPKHRYFTGLSLFALFIGLLIWDVFLVTDGVEGNTISEVIGDFAVAAWLVAFLAGHWWPQQRILARIWTKELAVLSIEQLKDMRIEVDRQIGSKERGSSPDF